MKKVIQGHRIIALDTCVWIYHFEDHPKYRKATAELLHHIEQGHCRAIVSELCLLELLVRPLRLNRQDIADEYETLLTHFPNVVLTPVSREVLLSAAGIRARHRLRTPDALIIATALQQGATLMFTNDDQWERVGEIDVVRLDDL